MRLIHQPKQNQANILPLFTVIIFSVNLLALALLIFNASMLNRIVSNLPQVLGQLIDGRAITLAPQLYNQRHPESIRRYVGETLTLMFTWSKKQPPETVLNFTLELFSQNVRNWLVTEINSEASGENIESVFMIQNISQPLEVKPGVWQLGVNARRVIFLNQEMNGESVIWQKNVIIEAIDTPVTKLDKPVNSLHQVVHQLSEVRLRIVNICDVTEKTCASE